MLIINADDWGRSKPETNAALECFDRGAMTSVSAMVFMNDSHRAARLALEARIEVGLHINLTEEFDSPEAPDGVRESQRRIARFLRRGKYALLIYHPGLRRAFQYVYQAQAEEFQRLYGTAPAHFDGHLHMHHCANMMIGRLIPGGQRVRGNFSFWPGEKGVLNRAYRSLADFWMSRSYCLTDYFFSLSTCLKTGTLPRVIELAQKAEVELMTHPVYPKEYEFLTGQDFNCMRKGVRRGSLASRQDCVPRTYSA
jgi:chitin disaccharide deacetylase